jgi:PTH1 family peptidyl-tRNA hydrolase
VIERLGRNDLPRLRFGLGRPTTPIDVSDWVLEAFTPAEEQALPPLIEAAADALDAWLFEGLAPAMNRFNRDPEPAAEASEPGAKRP